MGFNSGFKGLTQDEAAIVILGAGLTADSLQAFCIQPNVKYEFHLCVLTANAYISLAA